MAYKINRTDEHIVLPDGPASAREVRRAMKQQKNPEFYELEPAEVIKVYLDEEDLPKLANDKPDYSQYGFIEARMCISNDGEHDIILVAPLEVNIKDYPYPGEYVIVVEYFGTKFYTQKLNLYNNVDTNILPGLSKIHNPWKREGYKDNLPKVKDRGIRQLKAEEGVDLSGIEEGLTNFKTKALVNSKEIELLKVQIEEIKVSTSNPLTN